MSLNAMHRSIMIFSDTQQKAEDKLNELAASLNEPILKRSKDCIQTSTLTIQARWFGEYCRGFRYKEVYVDKTLKNDDEKMQLILTKLVPPHYYTDCPYDEHYNWREHIHYF
jgi:hypothetical protein